MNIRNDFFTKFARKIPDQASVLDVGCGTGKALRGLREARPDLKLFGVDIEDTRKLLPKDVSFSLGSVDRLSGLYKENTFDVIVCQHVIEHLPNPVNMILEFKKVLKPGGLIYIETPNWTRLFIPFHQNFFWNDYTHLRPYSKITFKRLFSDFDFKIADIKSFSTTPWPWESGSSGEISASNPPKPKSGKNSIKLGILGRLFSRLIGPFIPDVLAVVGENEK